MKIALLLFLILTATRSMAPANLDPLELWYQGYNMNYFGGELPKRVIIDHELHDDRFMGLTDYDQRTDTYIIRLNRKYGPSPKQERMTLLHEQCHIRQIIEGDEQIEQHGDHWQSCMHDLANKKAFEDLW